MKKKLKSVPNWLPVKTEGHYFDFHTVMAGMLNAQIAPASWKAVNWWIILGTKHFVEVVK